MPINKVISAYFHTSTKVEPIMTKQLTTLYLTLSLLFSVGLTACGEGDPETEAATAEMNVPDAPTEPTPFRMTMGDPPDIKEATPELENDTRPKRTSTGLIALYGIKSGKLVQRYEGERKGTRVYLFKDYGHFQRSTDTMQALNPRDQSSYNVLNIGTPTTMVHYNYGTKQGWRAPQKFSDEYQNSGMADSMFLVEYVFKEGYKAKRLSDTTINGYKTKVYRFETPNFVHTVWLWRGLILREHFFATLENVEYWVEPVSIETDISVKDSEFQVPESYAIEDRQGPPMPSALPPPQLGKPGDNGAQPSEPSDEFPIGE